MLNYNIEEKLDTTVSRLDGMRVVSTERIEVLYSDKAKEGAAPPATLDGFSPFLPPYTLFEQDKYYWFAGSFTVKEGAEFEKTYFSCDTHISGVACTIRPQGLLYLDGEICQGIDIYHTSVPVTPGKHSFILKFYTHTFIRSLPVEFSLRTEDTRIADAYYDFLVARDAVKLLVERTEDYTRSITTLERAMNMLDLRRVYSEEFYASLAATRDFLYKNYYVDRADAPTVYLIGHTHIDVAWMWDLCQTKQKVERSFATVLELMEEYPDYKFMSSQPVLHLFLKERNPELYKRVREKVREGRWEVDGGMWLEADCNLTSGESLVRQMLYGTRFFREEFGQECHTVWEPDVFGYSAALPQIMKGFGIERFVTTKIGWNDTNRLPYDAFIWQGIDGSQIFAMFISSCECDPRIGVFDKTYTSYTDPITPEHILGSWNRYAQKDLTRMSFMSYGWGDGGGGPTREMLENEKRLRYGVLGIPKTRLASLKETLDTAEGQFRASTKELRRMPKWNGELYFEYHRGTLTSVPRIKYNNRRGEFGLQNAELLSVISTLLTGSQYPREQLAEGWRTLLLNQFHDILPGSSIEKVYLDSDEQFAKLFAALRNIGDAAISAISEGISTEGGLLVFNPNGFCLTAPVEYEGRTVIAHDIPAFGYKVIKPEMRKADVAPGDHTLENRHYKISFAPDGSISSFVCKAQGRDIVKSGERINAFAAYEDLPYQYDNWEMTPYHKAKRYPLDDVASFAEIYDGERCGFEVVKRYGNSSITQKIYLYSELERVDFITKVEWHEPHELLKVEFPFDMLIDRATYDIQFGNIERNTCANTSWDSARFEAAGQKWVDMSEGGFGVALLNDAKYGFGTEDNTLTMTVVKSGSFPYEGASDIIPEFTYSLCPHRGSLYAAGIINEGYAINRPLIARTVGKNDGSLPESYSFGQCSDSGVIMETVKLAEDGDGIIVRMYEAFKERKNISVSFSCDVGKVFLADLAENNIKELEIKNGQVDLEIKPFEIITLKLI